MNNTFSLVEGRFEFGTVKWADWNNGFGFIIPDKPKQQDVHFLLDSGFEIHPGVEHPEFRQAVPKRLPGKGDRVVYVSVRDCKGPEASMWGYLYFYEQSSLIIANRDIFRVVKVGNGGGVLDQGTMEQLAYRHPRFTDGTDDFSMWLKGDRVIFEKQVSDGSFRTCKDPRPVEEGHQSREFGVVPKIVFEKQRPVVRQLVEPELTELDPDQELAELGKDRVAKFNSRYHKQPVAA